MATHSIRFVAAVIVLGVVCMPLLALAKTDNTAEEYQEAVRAERPSITYQVFSPALPVINFFKRVFAFVVRTICSLPLIERIC